MILDINECFWNNGGCDQLCVNKFGFHMCTCRPGFYLLPDNVTCAGKCNNNSYNLNSFIVTRLKG